jgi:E3 ubiquitin-protein ligase HUWE1
VRAGNNLNAATAILPCHPFPLPPDLEPEPEAVGGAPEQIAGPSGEGMAEEAPSLLLPAGFISDR